MHPPYDDAGRRGRQLLLVMMDGDSDDDDDEYDDHIGGCVNTEDGDEDKMKHVELILCGSVCDYISHN